MTEKELNTLVEDWSEAEPGDAAYQYAFKDWMIMNTNWTSKEFDDWRYRDWGDGARLG